MSILQDSFQSYDDNVKKVNPTYSGILGLQLNGEQRVEHPNRNGYVYVRLRDNLSEVVLAFNDKVSPVFNLPVVVERRGNSWYILGRDVDRYSNWGSSAPFLPKHGFQHSFDREGGTGGDTVFVFPDQFTPLLVYPSGTEGSSNLLVAPYLLQRDSDFIYVGNTGTPNLLPYRPPSGARMGLVYLNTDTGNPGFLINSGTFSSAITGTAGVAPYIPYPASNQEPLYAFRLVSGTESLQWENLYNARQFIGGAGGSSASTGSSIGALTPNRVVITDVSGTVTTDSRFFYDPDNETVILGDITATPGYPSLGQNNLYITKDGASPGLFMTALATGTATTAPFLAFFRSRGTSTGTAAILDDDVIGRIRGRGNDGAGYSNTQAELRLLADGNWSPTSHPTRWEFHSTPTGSTTNTLAMTVASDGALFLHNVKSGATQAAAGALAGEVWKNSATDALMLGV